MATQESAQRTGMSSSGVGVAVWLGEEIRLHLTWEQARQLHRLLVDALPEARR